MHKLVLPGGHGSSPTPVPAPFRSGAPSPHHLALIPQRLPRSPFGVMRLPMWWFNDGGFGVRARDASDAFGGREAPRRLDEGSRDPLELREPGFDEGSKGIVLLDQGGREGGSS